MIQKHDSKNSHVTDDEFFEFESEEWKMCSPHIYVILTLYSYINAPCLKEKRRPFTRNFLIVHQTVTEGLCSGF